MRINGQIVSPTIFIFDRQYRKHLTHISRRPASDLVLRGELDTMWLRGAKISKRFLAGCNFLEGKKLPDLGRFFRQQKAYTCPEFHDLEFFIFSRPHNTAARSEHYVQLSARHFNCYREFYNFSEKLFRTSADKIFLQRIDPRVIFKPEIMPVNLLYKTFYSQMDIEALYLHPAIGVCGLQLGKQNKLLRFYDARFKRKAWNTKNVDEVRVELQLRGAGLDKELGELTVADLPSLSSWEPFSCVEFYNIWRRNGRVRVKCNKNELEDYPQGYYYRRFTDREIEWADQFRALCQAHNFWVARRPENNWHRAKASILRPLYVSGVLLMDLLNQGFQRGYQEWIDGEPTV